MQMRGNAGILTGIEAGVCRMLLQGIKGADVHTSALFVYARHKHKAILFTIFVPPNRTI